MDPADQSRRDSCPRGGGRTRSNGRGLLSGTSCRLISWKRRSCRQHRQRCPCQDVTIEIASGSTAQDIAAALAAQWVVRSALEFEVAVRNTDSASRLQAGTYRMKTLMDPAAVVAILVVGPVAQVYRITVIEGLRLQEILTSLAETSGYPYQDFESALLDGSVSSSLLSKSGEVSSQDWEGLLFPDTYEFTRSAEPVAILQRLASTMEQRVDSIDWSELEDLGMTRYDGVIIASLIEAEVLLDDERPIVSGRDKQSSGVGDETRYRRHGSLRAGHSRHRSVRPQC